MRQDNSVNLNSLLLFGIVSFILIFIVCTNAPLDPDMWWHLKAGQTMWQQKLILTHDQFSFTKINQPWVNAFWISDLLIYLIFFLGGLRLLIIGIAFLAAIIFFLIYSRSSGPFFIRSLVILLAGISLSPEWTVRPQVFSFFLLALLNLWMEKRKLNRTPPLYFLPIFFIFWANIHGGYIWGFLLLSATMVGLLLDNWTQKTVDKKNNIIELKQLAIWSSISILTTLINPNGLAIWRLPFKTIAVSISAIQEWSSPNFHRFEMQPFLWMVFLLIIGYSLSGKKASFTDILKSVGFIYLAFVSQRNIPIAILVITPIVIDQFTEIWQNLKNTLIRPSTTTPSWNQRFHGSMVINFLIVIFLIIAAFGRTYLQTSPSLIEKEYPLKAIRSIQLTHPKVNMFNSYNWGGYLIWSLPEYPVFIDGRADLFGESLINEWWDVVNGTDKAMAILDKYHINFIILEPDWPIINILKNNQWNITYQDNISIVLTR